MVTPFDEDIKTSLIQLNDCRFKEPWLKNQQSIRTDHPKEVIRTDKETQIMECKRRVRLEWLVF